MEKIKPAVDAAAIKARMLKDEKGSLVRLNIARYLFLWTGLVFFTLVLASVGGLTAGNELATRALAQGAFVMYPAFLLSLATLAHAAWTHTSFVRTGHRRGKALAVLLGIVFGILVLPHLGIDVVFFKDLTGVDLATVLKPYLP